MLTNYPNGVSSFGLPLIGSGPILTTGNVFFVQSTHLNASNGNAGTSPDKPLATIDYAIGKCTANNGDYIIVGPTHVETVVANSGLLFDVAGVSVIGIGNGSARPTISIGAKTGANINFTAANCVLSNVLVTGGIDALTRWMHVQAADTKIIDLEYRDVTGQCTDGIIITANGDRALIKGLVYRGAAAAGSNSGIAVIGAEDVVIEDFDIDGNFAVGAIDVRTTAAVNLRIRNGWARTRNAADIFLVDTITGSTGLIGPNINVRVADNAANVTEALTGATFVYFQPIRIVNQAGESSMETNITATTDA